MNEGLLEALGGVMVEPKKSQLSCATQKPCIAILLSNPKPKSIWSGVYYMPATSQLQRSCIQK